jgi:hypothetical protein
MAETAAGASASAALRTADARLRAKLEGDVLKLGVVELLKRMSEVDPARIILLRRKMMSYTKDKIVAGRFNIFEFQGFSALMQVKKFLVIAQNFKMNMNDLIDDIMFIIAMNIYMGNLLEKNRERRSQEGKDMVAAMVAKYGIQLGSTGTGKASHITTVPRVVAAFPILSTRMASVLVPQNLIGMPFSTLTLPGFMRVPSFASFISVNLSAGVRDFLLKSVASYSSDQAVIFSTDRKTKKPSIDAVTAFSNQWTYITAASNSDVLLEWEKGAMLGEFKVHELYSVLLPIVENLNTKTGSTESIMSESDFKKDLNSFYALCDQERTEMNKQDELTLASSSTKKPPTGPAQVGPSRQSQQAQQPLQSPRSQRRAPPPPAPEATLRMPAPPSQEPSASGMPSFIAEDVTESGVLYTEQGETEDLEGSAQLYQDDEY